MTTRSIQRRPTPTLPVENTTSQTMDLVASVVGKVSLVDALRDRITLRLDEVAAALGVSRRAIERERSAGRFPQPDLHIGRMPLWRPETIRNWVEGGGRP